MPANRNALIRYKTIDTCLRNRFRRWTLSDLVEACSEALYEYEGIDKGVSIRTVQMDIQMMRSDKLGYNAPIIVVDKKYYTYEDPEYSITNIPLSNQDIARLDEVVQILKQFSGFRHFQDMSEVVQKLQHKVHIHQHSQRPIIEFEKNELLKGLNHLDALYQAVLNRTVLEITYQSFRAKAPSTFLFHPYLLKEFKNRWFLLGKRNQETTIMTLALDRIHTSKALPEESFSEDGNFHPSDYYRDIVGVTNTNTPTEKVVIAVDKYNAPYVTTKPLHHSQQIVQANEDGSVIIMICVKINFELEREILGYGDSMHVLQPSRLKLRLQHKLKRALNAYEHNE
ncbi:MAG: helix-turn-helix transcriptional regulator [Thermonemataceae bacterium]